MSRPPGVSPGLRRLLLGSLCLLSSCVVGGGGYDDYGDYYGSDGVAYVDGYYGPVGGVYGGWGSGYHVGPPRPGGLHQPGGGGTRFRGAPGGRTMPSIPGRSGGGHPGGGGRGGGGGGRGGGRGGHGR